MIQAGRDLTLGRAVRAKFVRDDPFRNKAPAFLQLDQQSFRRPFVPPGREDFIQNKAV